MMWLGLFLDLCFGRKKMFSSELWEIWEPQQDIIL